MSTNSQLIQKIKENLPTIVSGSVSEYEKSLGGFRIQAVRANATDLTFKLLSGLVDNLEYEDTEGRASEFKNILLAILFELQFNDQTISAFLTAMQRKLIEFADSTTLSNPGITNIIDQYFNIFSQRITDYTFYASTSGQDILKSQPEYQICEGLSSIPIKQYEGKTSTIYTLFTKERYWEYYKLLSREAQYTPFKTENIYFLQSPEGVRRPSELYNETIVYEDKIYKLNPEVVSVNKSQFDQEQWSEYVPKRFNKSKAFSAVYSDLLKSAFGKFSEYGFEINQIISDSKIAEYEQDRYVNETTLSSTFGGRGAQLFKTTKELKYVSQAFGGYEGSIVGGLSYITDVVEHLLVGGLGKTPTATFDKIGNALLFGKFNSLYSVPYAEDSIPGLKFLDKFNKLKAFSHAAKVNKSYVLDSKKMVYNAISTKFNTGLKNNFSGSFNQPSYLEPPNFDLLLYAVENLYRKCLVIGDDVNVLYKSLDEHGRIRGYESLGSVEPQLYELRSVFPASKYIQESTSEVLPGLTGVIKFILSSYSSFSQIFNSPVFPGKYLEFFGTWIEKITTQVDGIVSVIRESGIEEGAFIPDLSFRFVESKDSKITDFLRSLGFRDSEISNLLSVNSFSDLISKFAPLSNSDDIKSFFKAFELCQLIYEFGGQEGIDAYLAYLFSNNELENLLNLLDLSQKDPSKITHWNMSRYPKLIGLLIGLTYAVDPTQLIKFNALLKQNNLNLLESISYLFKNGNDAIIKRPEDINLLNPVVEQMISGAYGNDIFTTRSATYPMMTKSAPLALRRWAEIIGDNSGKVDSTKVLQNLFDKSVGLTPKELLALLNDPRSINEFGALTDGFFGGNFTAFLKYANLSGLGVKFGFYKNSYQTDNVQITKTSKSLAFLNLVDSLGTLAESLNAIRIVFESSLDYTFQLDSGFSRSLEPLIFAQNKDYETISKLIELDARSGSDVEKRALSSGAQIIESPGVGNSRLPNRVPVVNSISPEQAQVLSSAIASVDKTTTSEVNSKNIIDAFIKFTNSNRLSSNIAITDQTLSPSEAKSRTRVPTSNSSYQVLSTNPTTTIAKPYTVPKMYVDESVMDRLNSSMLGVNYLSEPSANFNLNVSPGASLTPFDPVASCKRFGGGSECDQLYGTQGDVCRNLYNKALYPESYTQVPGALPNSVIIDRPLGTFAEYKPISTLIPTSSLESPASFYSLLPESAKIGAKGEPILDKVYPEPILPMFGNGALSEYANTEFGLIEFIRAKFERNSEFNCATLESPFQYQMCMNLMKCKRFVPPYNNQNSLNFCPRSLAGGRAR